MAAYSLASCFEMPVGNLRALGLMVFLSQKNPNRLILWFADVSFSMYLIHGAAGYALLGWLYRLGFGVWSFLIVSAGMLGLGQRFTFTLNCRRNGSPSAYWYEWRRTDEILRTV